MTYRTRRCLSPLKAPSAMWLMELWLRRSVLRLLRSARLSSSSRVRLLKDKTLGEASKRHRRARNTGTPCPLLNIEPQSAGGMTGHWQAHQNPKGQRGRAARNPQGPTPTEFGSWSICIDHEDQRARYKVIKPDNPQGSDPSCQGPWRILTQAIRDLSRQGLGPSGLGQ